MEKQVLNSMFENLLHIWNKTNFWNAKMKPYIYGSVNGIHVINLLETAKKLEEKGYNTPIDFVIRRINFHCESMDPEVRKDPANWVECEVIVRYDPTIKSFEQKLDNGAIKKQKIIPLVKSYLAQKWFRDEKGIHVEVHTHKFKTPELKVMPRTFKFSVDGVYHFGDFKTYEETLRFALFQELDTMRKLLKKRK